jgi:FecR protein
MMWTKSPCSCPLPACSNLFPQFAQQFYLFNFSSFKEGKVTQVIQDVQVLPSNASPRPAAVNDNVRQGTAVQTGVQSRSELTFKDQTITRLGEKTIFSVGEGARTIDLGSGQFLLCVPKKAGGARVKAGAVTTAITG